MSNFGKTINEAISDDTELQIDATCISKELLETKKIFNSNDIKLEDQYRLQLNSYASWKFTEKEQRELFIHLITLQIKVTALIDFYKHNFEFDEEDDKVWEICLRKQYEEVMKRLEKETGMRATETGLKYA